MGPNGRLYLSLIDELFHRNNDAAAPAHLTRAYRSHDPFVDDTGVGGRRGLSQLVLHGLREVRYETCDVIEEGDRVAARFLLTGRRANGARVVVPGLSINRVDAGRLDEGWILADYTDIDDLVTPTTQPRDAWLGDPLAVAPAAPGDAKSRLAMYCWLIDQTYAKRRPAALREALHPEYVGFDPFRDRGVGVAGTIAFTEKVIAMYKDVRYHVVDAVEQGDRLAVRYRVEATDSNGRHVVVPGLSFNHFEGARIRRGWVLNHYGAMS